MDLEEIKRRLFHSFKNNQQILIGYIFGSYAKELTNFQSDIDIAFYLKENIYYQKDTLTLELKLIDQVTEALVTDNVDVVLLNDAPIILAYKIVKDGIIFLCKNEEKRAAIESLIIRKYLDFQYFSQEYDKCLTNRIKKSTKS